MTAKIQIDTAKYRRLLSRVLPVVIQIEEENERMLREIERLMGKDSLSPEEDRLFDLMTKLVEDYERDRYPISDVPPDRLLSYLEHFHFSRLQRYPSTRRAHVPKRTFRASRLGCLVND